MSYILYACKLLQNLRFRGKNKLCGPLPNGQKCPEREVIKRKKCIHINVTLTKRFLYFFNNYFFVNTDFCLAISLTRNILIFNNKFKLLYFVLLRNIVVYNEIGYSVKQYIGN